MATNVQEQFNLSTAIKLVPSFNGGTESDLSAFIIKCEFVLSNVSDLNKVILQAIVSQLSGKAFESTRYRDINTWDELKSHFRTIFGTSYSIPYLQKQLN